MKNETPLMQQYNEIKKKYSDAIVLFRVGDFYECFSEDAIIASKILNITLTKRSPSPTSVALAGFPYHAMDTYLPKLVNNGYRVAICEQLEDPKNTKKLIKRGVTEVVTPGISFHDGVLNYKYNNYLSSIYFGQEIGISLLDISTGEFLVSEGNINYIKKLLESFKPAEVLVAKKQKIDFFDKISNNYNYYTLEDWIFDFDYGSSLLNDHFNVLNLKGFGIEKMPYGIIAAGSILKYLYDTEHKQIGHILNIKRIENDQYVWMDGFTIDSLELIVPAQEDGMSLLDAIDCTSTAIGARMLVKWILFPLKEIDQICYRLNIVEALLKHDQILNELISILKQIIDLERLVSKIAVRRVNPRDILSLCRSLSTVERIKELLLNSNNNFLIDFAKHFSDFSFLIEKINNTLNSTAPLIISNGFVIKNGFNKELDELRQIAYSSKEYLIKIQNEERYNTGINSLKVSYNKIYGFYIEVSNTHKNKIPIAWMRKQTLSNAERYITPELKAIEDKIITAESQCLSIEERCWNQLICEVAEFTDQIQILANSIGKIDCFASFALLAKENNYCKPIISDTDEICIEKGRHPVIEKRLSIADEFIANDLNIDQSLDQILIITGPNMAGKSAFLRQTALIVILAQIGSFVPAKSAKIGYVDKIFTRVGASDNISKGESTFMLEMSETASIVNNLSHRSLVLMDEIGRGTSTYDGLSIAWAIIEYLHNNEYCNPKTLFATHYHELSQLENSLHRVKNYNISVRQIDDKILFLRKLVAGSSACSFGINVAKMAGLPNFITERASEVLSTMSIDLRVVSEIKKVENNKSDKEIFNQQKIIEALYDFDINKCSPIDALLKLNEMIILLNK